MLSLTTEDNLYQKSLRHPLTMQIRNPLFLEVILAVCQTTLAFLDVGEDLIRQAASYAGQIHHPWLSASCF